MSKIVVKEGDDLYKDGIKLKLEFGNLEQIQAIRNHERLIEDFKEEGVSPNCNYVVEVTAHANFTCICGKNMVTVDVTADDEEDEACFDGLIHTCKSCNRKYEFVLEKHYKNIQGKRHLHYEEIFVKLK